MGRYWSFQGVAAIKSLRLSRLRVFGRASDLMRQRDNEWWARQLGHVLPSASEWVVVPARNGAWIRNFVPWLWPFGSRLIAVRGEEVLVFSQNIARTRGRREVWRGRRRELDARPYVQSRMLRIGDHGSTVRLQVDGRSDVDRLRRALDRLP